MTEMLLAFAAGGVVLGLALIVVAAAVGRPMTRDYVEGAVLGGYSVAVQDCTLLKDGDDFVVHLDGVGYTRYGAFDEAYDAFVESAAAGAEGDDDE